ASSQMMSLVGCSGEDFEGILRSLGYRKHAVKRPAAPPAAAPSTAAPAADAATSPVDAPPELVPDEAAPAAVAAEVAPEGAAPLTEAAGGSQPQETSQAAEPADSAAGVAGSEVEVMVWRMAPRRPPNAGKRPQKRAAPRDQKAPDAHRPTEARDGRPPRREKREGKKPFRNDDAPRQYSSAPRRDRGPDPNSPFAVLAALKANMAGGGPKTE
ncbi:MAG: hypothetical protein HXY21_08175, partial [Parvularculaceae bacterium]|nr:hypothetical protein [Parvularculaceae bacterium]